RTNRPGGPGRLLIKQTPEAVTVDTGVLTAPVGLGRAPIPTLVIEGRDVGRGGPIVASSAAPARPRAPRRPPEVVSTHLRLARAGEVEAVLRRSGDHEVADERTRPFVLRLYLTAGSTRIRVVHSLVFDADPDTLFLTSLGLRFDVPLRAEPHDRHVRV